MAQSNTFLLKGLSQKHKDFLHLYAMKELGSSSRTKAIIHIIEQKMAEYDEKSNENQENIDRFLNEKQEYIEHHQQKIQQHNQDIIKAKENKDYQLVKQLSCKNIKIDKKRLQLSLPIYVYNGLEKLSNISNSSLQYYVISLIYKHLYGERKLLGNEIEVLKKSNYELYKIGVNVNQIAKANNIGDMVELPINKLYSEIQSHIKVVQKLLNDSIGIY